MSASPFHLVSGLQTFINGGATILNQTEGEVNSEFPEFELDILPDKYLFGVTGTVILLYPKNNMYSFSSIPSDPQIQVSVGNISGIILFLATATLARTRPFCPRY